MHSQGMKQYDENKLKQGKEMKTEWGKEKTKRKLAELNYISMHKTCIFF